MEGQKYKNESGYARKPADQIYWTDWVTDKIQLAKLDGSAIQDVIINDLDTPQGFALISC